MVRNVRSILSSPEGSVDSYRISIYDLLVAILNFKCRDTESLHRRRRVGRFANIETVARRNFTQLDAAASLKFLRIPPGNRLEQLKGDRVGQHSIRINDQWRICFTWTSRDPTDVEIVDYH